MNMPVGGFFPGLTAAAGRSDFVGLTVGCGVKNLAIQDNPDEIH